MQEVAIQQRAVQAEPVSQIEASAQVPRCPKCNTTNNHSIEELGDSDRRQCNDCGRKWRHVPGETGVYATMPQRLGAYLADLVIVYFIIFGVYFAFGMIGKPLGFSDAEFKGISLLVLFLYMTTAQTLYHTTIGKYVTGLEVTSAAGEQYPSFGNILLRETFGRIGSGVLFGAGYWRAVRNPRKQAWSDSIANTVVRPRATNQTLRRALSAFIVGGLIAGVGLIAWGQHIEDRDKRRADLENRITSLSTTFGKDRAAATNIMRREVSDLESWQSNMQAFVKALDSCDNDIDLIVSAIDDGTREGLWQGMKAKQYDAMKQAAAMRREQSGKFREEAGLILQFTAGVSDREDLLANLRGLDSDIAAINNRVTGVLKEAGIQ
jgi:hypothetical protein